MNKQDSLGVVRDLMDKMQVSILEDERSLLKYSRSEFASLYERAAELEQKINLLPEGDECLAIESQAIRFIIMEIQASYARLQGKIRRKNALLGGFMFIAFIVALIVWWSDIGALLSGLLESTNLLKYILLGVGGAGVFFITTGITDNISVSPAGGVDFQTVIARIILAAIIPIVLVLILFNKHDADGNFQIDASAALCFATGYSSKLVLLLLNKIVEKGEKIITAI